jgi:hypothetical protein
MICTHCRKAGELAQALADVNVGRVAELLSIGVNNDTLQVTVITKIVEEMHKQCRGGTWCDCHHRLTGVNWIEINREKELQPA